MNPSKTEYLELDPQTPGEIELDGTILPRTTELSYLGSTMSITGDTTAEAAARANATWLKWRNCTGVMCDRKMPRHLNSKIYKTVIRPVAFYGSQIWAMTKKVENTMNVLEMRIARWSLGVTRLDRIPNDVIRHKLGIAPITEKLREGRLRWYGHVKRQDPKQSGQKNNGPDGGWQETTWKTKGLLPRHSEEEHGSSRPTRW